MERTNLRKIKYYKNILSKNTDVADFYSCGKTMLEGMNFNLSYSDSVIYLNSIFVTAPVLISYVLYILKDAQKCNIKRLYFLSRDGYIMHKIAVILCSSYKINIECRYLYVSRFTLRSPLYLIDKNDAMNYFCQGGSKISAETVLQRAGISTKLQKYILHELNVENSKKYLTDNELNILGENLKKSICFDKEANCYAKEKYQEVYEYLIQQGLGEEENYAVVDTGWMGSMQRHIRQILEYSKKGRVMNGYYFGMFANGKKEDGNYKCFYFSKEYKNIRKVFFNNNLFECMCSANHGMTIGYKKNKDNIIIPVFKDYEIKWNVDIQLDAVKKFAEQFAKNNKLENIKINRLPKLIEKLLISFMIFPSKEEAEIYGDIPFCDDSTESYMINLADRLTKDELYEYNIFYKIYKKIFFRKTQKKIRESFWINGTIQLSDIYYKRMFNLQCIMSEYIHYLIGKM